MRMNITCQTSHESGLTALPRRLSISPGRLGRLWLTRGKATLKGALNYCGLDVKLVRRGSFDDVGTDRRPLAGMDSFLLDIRHRGFSPQGILDVGAHRGDWTRLALEVFPEAAALMIEPQVEMGGYLKQVVRDLSRAEWICAGAGAQAAELPLELDFDFDGSSFVTTPDPAKLASGAQRLLPIVTIDSLMAERPLFTPDFVKMDVQGFELEALKGAQSLFGKTELFILETSLFMDSECWHPTTRDIIAYMSEASYEFYDVTGFLRRPSDGALGQIDLAFARADGILRRSKRW